MRGAPTLGEVAELWLAERQAALAPATVRVYRDATARLGDLRGLRLPAVTAARLAARVAELSQGGYSASSINQSLRVVSQVFRWARRRLALDVRDPVPDLGRVERPARRGPRRRVLTAGEVAALLGAAGERWRPLFWFAAATGARLGEVLALRWRDLDLEAGVCRIERQLTREGRECPPKTEAGERTVPLPGALVGELRAWRLRSPWSQPDDFVFASENGTPLDRSNVRRAFDRALGAARFPDGRPAFPEVFGAREGPKPTFHSLRHTAASLMFAAGGSVTDVSRILGHATPGVTLQVYARWLDGRDHEARRRDLVERASGGFAPRGPWPEARGGASMEALWKRYGSASASTGGNRRER